MSIVVMNWQITQHMQQRTGKQQRPPSRLQKVTSSGEQQEDWNRVEPVKVVFWKEGELASPAIVQMAETGATFLLANEIDQAITNGNAFYHIDERHWFCSPELTHDNCGKLTFQFEAHSDFPLVTLVSMLGPSPDWFVGVNGLSLTEDSNWIDELTVELYPFDGGTRENNLFALFGPSTNPQEEVSLITEDSCQIITPQLLGRMIFTRMIVLGDINCDTQVNLLDVAPFVELLSSGSFQSEADLNGDGSVDLLDVQPFVDLLVG